MDCSPNQPQNKRKTLTCPSAEVKPIGKATDADHEDLKKATPRAHAWWERGASRECATWPRPSRKAAPRALDDQGSMHRGHVWMYNLSLHGTHACEDVRALQHMRYGVVECMWNFAAPHGEQGHALFINNVGFELQPLCCQLLPGLSPCTWSACAFVGPE